MNYEQKIEDRLAERIKDIEIVIAQSKKGEAILIEDDCSYVDILDWINSYALWLGEDPHYRAIWMELSTGGPADGFRFFRDGTIEYYFQGWTDGAIRRVSNEAVEDLRDIILEIYKGV